MRAGITTVAHAAVAAAIFAAQPVHGFWRMRCPGRTGVARMDPLVEPGAPSDHAHTIHGGNNFGFDTGYDDLMASDCTSCAVTQDRSAYWTPTLQFVYPNGTSELVGQTGGMLAYYLLFGENIQAFPPGFRLLAGDTLMRNFSFPVPDPPKSSWSGDAATQDALRQKALGFNCLNYDRDPEATLYRHTMPSKQYLDDNCANGLRLELMFPSCWNGQDLDSDDHKSHVAYPSLVMDGDCPEGFEQRVPSLLYETIWATQDFAGVEGEFVISNGDPTGCGYHGDFIAGWDEDFLQLAVDTCTNPSGNIEDCPHFDIQSEDDCRSCKFTMPSELDDDDCEGPREGLPGNVPIQAGPEYASKVSPGDEETFAPSSDDATSSLPVATHMPSLGYSAGTRIATDNYGEATDLIVAEKQQSTAEPAETTPLPTLDDIQAVSEEEEDSNAVTTTTYTSAGIVYELVIEEVEVTVTATTTAAVKHRRHVHHHNHHHGAHF
ncbi:hypothetical protein BDY21DRAFT_365361 [Lineolata rhizophorae]|uniref:DUF1996 domain-containing protein n=1 Tax=Lineolata rhizophorae TaxID=578093 RepID=A0A6A6NVM0_9PEZI|nr:hypothetical protein BDY21DRAFT_365361 [Lineolata rhizophorae]